MNRQKQIFAITLLLLVLSVAWAYVNWPRQKSVTTLKYAPGQQAEVVRTKPGQSQSDDGRVLNLALLEKEQPPFKGYRRNIFKPLWFDDFAAVKQKAVAVRPIAPPPPPPPVAPVIQPRRELARFTFMGFLHTGDRKTVFLGMGKEILLVRSGDIFAGRYKAAQITDKALTIKVTDGDEEIIVPLIDSRPFGSGR